MDIFLLLRPQMAAEFEWALKKASGVPKAVTHIVTTYKYASYRE